LTVSGAWNGQALNHGAGNYPHLIRKLINPIHPLIILEDHLSIYRDATVLLTGACGTVSSELLAQLSLRGPRQIIGLDNNESAVFHAAADWQHDERVKFVLGDIRDLDRLNNLTRGVDLIIHTAAYKHVSLCDNSPSDAVSTNITGTQNVIEAAFRNNARRVMFTSSDKAVTPTTVMGATKLICEQLMTAASASARSGGKGPIFASIRFGNVLGSSGSVVPVFLKQIAAGGPITLTDPRMTRFVMTISEAGKAVLHSLSIAKGGEVFTTKMPALNIKELADALIARCGAKNVEIEVIGARRGEKLHEELFNAEESQRIVERGNYFIIQPKVTNSAAARNGKATPCRNDFHASSEAISLSEAGIIHMLKQLPPAIGNGERARR
jgi:FlaA1/EpsC-like NDP-sugar epimerase